jgi:membrane-associated HD superfamily phosphohydrolase
VERVRAAFSDHESNALWEGMMKMVREQEGAEEAFQSLSSREQRGFEAMQNAGMHRDIYDESDETVQELVEQAREAFEALDEGERQRVESALTSRARGVFEEVRSKIESSQSEENAPSEEKGQDEGQDSSSKYDRGYGRGRF